MNPRKTNAEMAQAIWDEACPIDGTAAQAYLAARGIALPRPEACGLRPR